jgi:WD40 repeat protein
MKSHSSVINGSKPNMRKPAVEQHWVRSLGVRVRGFSSAREKGSLLVWDDSNGLHLLNRHGEHQAQVRPPGALTSACVADDGSAYAAVGERGEIWWLAPDLSVRWERFMPSKAVAVATDPFGQYLAVSDSRGNLHLLDRFGKLICGTLTPRPLHFLSFIPTSPLLVGSADYGLVACYDLSGRPQWRDGLVAHAGSLSVSENGGHIVLACFTEGLQRYSLDGKNLGRLSAGEPCRLASLSFDGRKILVAGLSNKVLMLDQTGRVLVSHSLERSPVALALGPLAKRAVFASADGSLLELSLRQANQS